MGFFFRTAFKCAMMFKNLTDLPIKVLDIIPDLIAQNDDPEIEQELAEKEISFDAFEIDDVCPAPGVSGGTRLKAINKAKKRANARCYAFVSDDLFFGMKGKRTRTSTPYFPPCS